MWKLLQLAGQCVHTQSVLLLENFSTRKTVDGVSIKRTPLQHAPYGPMVQWQRNICIALIKAWEKLRKTNWICRARRRNKNKTSDKKMHYTVLGNAGQEDVDVGGRG